jgi:hypothetical protein
MPTSWWQSVRECPESTALLRRFAALVEEDQTA